MARPDRAHLDELHRQRSRIRTRGLIEGLFACVIVGGLWLTSSWWNFGLFYGSFNGISQGIILDAGNVVLYSLGPDVPYVGGWVWVAEFHRMRWAWVLGPLCAPYGTRGFVVLVPFWSLFCLYAGATVVIYFRRRGLMAPHHCSRCGYDLTGNVTGTCPECGAAMVRITETIE